MERLLADISDEIEIGTFLVTLLFPLVTSTFWKWWRSDLGWTITVMDILLCLTFMFPAIHLIFGLNDDTLFFQWFLSVLFLVQPVVAWRAIVLYRAQRDPVPGNGRHAENGPNGVPHKPEPAELPEPTERLGEQHGTTHVRHDYSRLACDE